VSTSPTAAEQDPRPRVRVPRPIAPGLLIVGIGAAIAVLLLLSALLRPRAAIERTAPAAESAAIPEPPPLAIPPDAPPPPALIRPVLSPAPVVTLRALATEPRRTSPVVRTVIERPLPAALPVSLPLPKSETPAPSPAAQAIVIDNGQDSVTAGASGPGSPATTGNAPPSSAGAGTIARGGTGDDTPIRSSTLRSRTNVVPSGTLIPAVLETPIDTARPGLLRAMVTRDVRGFDGSAVLIPRGSRLIGEYDADARSGQNRVFATWTRLIRPDGTTSRIGSPAADALGGGGIPGKVHSFFWQRFGAAVLQSALAAGVAYAGSTSGTSVILAAPATQTGSTLGQTLTPSADLRPKITVKPGVSVDVFVARDLELPSIVQR
jgi:type IV secretion system protein VirB10